MYDYVREELGVCYLEDAGFTLHGHLLIALLLQLPGPGAVQLLTNLQKTKKTASVIRQTRGLDKICVSNTNKESMLI